jgi:HlyD family secretion protein
MTANVSIIIAHKDDVLKIANAALRYRPADATPAPRSSAVPSRGGPGRAGAGGERRTERTVYVLRGGKPAPVQIKTGISDGISTEVLEGLKENDSVITAQLNAANGNAQQPANPFGGPPRRF